MPGHRVLIANRGEIAVRVIKACVDEGLESVLAVSEADVTSLAAQLADRVVRIGPAPAMQSYLDVGRVVTAAVLSGCDMLHPGYGFLSERPELSAACRDAGIAFVGPSPEAIRRGGDKASARALASSLGVPLGAGSAVVSTTDGARAAADRLGYPVLVKAAAGGGGRGMRRVTDSDALTEAFTAASREAEHAFGDGRLFLEAYLPRARHVEVQVLGDCHGGVIHLGDRDCTLQRRYQKLVEEAPATRLSDRLRAELTDAAVRMIEALDYTGAATCEFLVDTERGTAAFLEINARLQVEHPVTEAVTGIDVVREQLRIADGARLSVAQSDVVAHGHAVEARVNAEAPERGFAPCPGRLDTWVSPVGSNVRVDTGCYPGWTVAPHYDSLLAKIIARGDSRADALGTLRTALGHLRVEGVPTTAGFVRDLLASPDVVAEQVYTTWVEDAFLPTWKPGESLA